MARRLLLLVAVLACVAAACGGGDDDAPPDRTIAFLRAVGNADEPQAAFLEPLAEAGWIQGENLTIVAGDPMEAHTGDAAAEAVAGWLDEGVDLIVALSSSGAKVADEAAPDVPVLFLSTDPVATGLVADERAPEGHLTGGTFQVPADRTLDVAIRALGGPVRFGLLWPAEDPAAMPVVDEFERAAGTLDVEVVDRSFADPAEVQAAVDALVAEGAEALVLANAPSLVMAFDAIRDAAVAARLPVFANTSNDFAVATLRPDTTELYRQLGRQAVRLLSGTPVAKVPVEDPASYVVVVDRSAASKVGLTLPDDLLELADEVVG